MTPEAKLDTERTKISEFGQRMLKDGLTLGTGGNISVRNGNHVAISPSGVPYDEIEPEDVPVVDLEGDHIAGESKPSSEFRMHTDVIRERPDVGGVVHTHSPYASTFASMGEPIPASHYLIAFIGDEVPVAPYETYGTAELATAALETLGEEYNACLLENHGVLAVGETVDEAYEVAMMVEYCAQIHYQAISVGEPEILSNEAVTELIEIFEHYGEHTDSQDEATEVPVGDALQAERAAVSELGRQMLEDGLTKGTGGNVSSRNGEEVAINPSGVPYEEITPETVPLVDLQGEQVAGKLPASSESPMHTAIYRAREDVGGVVHTHSPYASTFASLQEPIEASHYLIAFAGDQVPVTAYETPATEALGELAVEALGDEYGACLLGNHGVITIGESVEEAYEIALMTEYCARIHYQARSVGEPKILADTEIKTLTERFADYGQQS
ncbi:class II aldolase/adducin family protein [Natronococcus occultus]|uniref:Ribulose-5-phosphate 4-epimerase-like epimerase or aldolase n=1 Tax=Natronococcus occultus SP4 TaxID=694430 RepID=L0JWD8_9EURY|nr:class II aldolase/adducin family protein [Natronococcus occultus]AGB37091.1 ribulose-5-phosphate 4-epimerase-like epimerase or aldolase [Natronococcus occultus SP4]